MRRALKKEDYVLQTGNNRSNAKSLSNNHNRRRPGQWKKHDILLSALMRIANSKCLMFALGIFLLLALLTTYQPLLKNSISQSCLQMLENTRPTVLIICDPSLHICEGMSELPVSFISTSPQELSQSIHALSSVIARAGKLAELVVIGNANEFTAPVDALLTSIGPHHIATTAWIPAGSLPSTASTRVFRQFRSFEWDIAYPLLPAPMPAFRERSGWRSGRQGLVARLVTADNATVDLSTADWVPFIVAASVHTFHLTSNTASIAEGKHDIQISLIIHSSSQGDAGIVLSNWKWPEDRPLTALALAGYDALVCGEDCDPTDIAALLELAAACALPVALLSYPARFMEGTRLAGFPFITSRDLGEAGGNTSNAAVISAAMQVSHSAAKHELHIARSRLWLHGRRSSSLKSLAKVLGHPLYESTDGAVDSSVIRMLNYDELSAIQQRTVAFFASELAPITPGGAGVIASAMVLSLVNAGVSVVVIGDFACDAVSQWDTFARRHFASTAAAVGVNPTPLFTTHCADELVKGASWHSQQEIIGQADDYLRASIKAAVAVQVAYQRTPFVGIEFFDFNGPAYELLRARTDGLAAGKPLYIPPYVRVWVRCHGTMGAIDEIEVPLSTLTRQQAMRHRLEQYSLEAADAVLLQSPLILDLFSCAYQLRGGVAMHAPPPMQAVADMFLARERSYAAEESCFHEVDDLPLPCGASKHLCASFLVLGKLQRVKSPKTVASALGLALADPSLPHGQQLHAVFVGGDAYCEEHRRQVSECLPLAVPRLYRSSVHVAPPLSKNCVPLAVSRLRPIAAVLASEFETFNLAAHELVRLGLPVVVSDTAGFAAFFNSSNAYVFRAGDAASLAEQLLKVTVDADEGRTKLAGSLRYDNAIEPYQQLLNGVKNVMEYKVSLSGDSSHTFAFLWPSEPLRQLLRNDVVLLQAGGARDNENLVRCG